MARSLHITGMTKLLCAAALVLLLAPGASVAKAPPPGSGSEDVPANILLMLDTSGSMAEIIQEGESQYPMDVAFDSSGNTYVATYYDYVEKYDSTGNMVMTWGGFGTSNGKFDNVYALTVDGNNNVFVSDYNNHRVQKFNSSGVYQCKFTLSGSRAYGIARDSSNNIYVVNGNGDIEKYNNSCSKIGSTWNTPSGSRHVAIDGNNNVYITVKSGSTERVYRYNSSGSALSPAYFNLGYEPYGIATDNLNQIYVTDVDNDRIYKYSSTGTYLQYWGSTGSATGQFDYPKGIEKSATGIIYAADYYNHRIQSPTGETPIKPLKSVTRLEAMQEVIKAIVSNSELTTGANFGLLTWSSSALMKVDISEDGALDIYNMIDSLTPNGGTVLDSAMNLAKTYMLGGTSPMVDGASCQQNILIVVSDGEWTDTTASATAEELLDDHGIKTFAVGFQTTGGANYVTLSQKGGTYPDSPLYASNQENLLEVLSNYIREVISAQLSFSTPTIMPGVSGDDYLVQATFTYEQDHQWKGRLFKYDLTDAGMLGDVLWDAGTVLTATPAASRQIWTVGNGITAGLNNFTVDSLDRLRQPLEETSATSYTDAQLTALINFVRGVDSYGEFPTGKDGFGDTLIMGERWKLADVYHSRSVVVGLPTAYSSDEASVNSEAYYRFVNGYFQFRHGATCGGSCEDRDEVVYVGANDGMLHAFDSATGAEKWAFIPPSVVPSLRGMIASETAKSASIYGVDGTPVVKDIFYGGEWRTVLMMGLRQGGHSYFALDITDPNNPEHLFTFASFPERNLVSYWDADGTRTNYSTLSPLPVAYNYTTLGEAWSDPVILKLTIGGLDKWVALVAGGYNSGVNPNYGAHLFVLDLENGGQIIQDIAVADGDSTNSIVNAVPPRVTAITADSTNLFQKTGAMVYFSDLEGKLWKVNLTSEGTLYETTRIFNAQATSSNDRYSYHETTATITPDMRLIQYFGTADIQSISKTGASIANRAYGVYDQNFPDFSSVAEFNVGSMQNVTAPGASCPSGTQKGWYINLESNEKVTGKMSIANQTVFIPRYKPDSSQICQAGTARVSQVQFTCGSHVSTIDLGAGVPTEVIVYKNKLYIGVSSDAEVTESLPDGFVKQGNLIIGTPAVEGIPTVRVETWKEEF